MFEFLAYRCTQGYLTCNPEKATKQKPLVPQRWREQVIQILKQTGFDEDGQMLAQEQE